MVQKNDILYGSDVSSGTYKCNDCGHEITTKSKGALEPCPIGNLKTSDSKYVKHIKHSWQCLTGVGDAKKDPYPKSK